MTTKEALERAFKAGYEAGGRDNNDWGWRASKGSPNWNAREEAWRKWYND